MSYQIQKTELIEYLTVIIRAINRSNSKLRKSSITKGNQS